MTRLKAVREDSGDRILTVIYSDNYFTLMPEENRTLRGEPNYADTRGESPRIVVSGFNVKAARVSGTFHHHQSASRASDDNWKTGT